jgi:hypothetical protein
MIDFIEPSQRKETGKNIFHTTLHIFLTVFFNSTVAVQQMNYLSLFFVEKNWIINFISHGTFLEVAPLAAQ